MPVVGVPRHLTTVGSPVLLPTRRVGMSHGVMIDGVGTDIGGGG